ncbi:MAG: hypothetical protein HY517_00555 [Candidatus Aenigmarchaeota archaeon]|nr:hypothetical protein [Candidatus Aenigmarchaeota archaeon]
MVEFDENRLRYPNEYVEVKGTISNLKLGGGFAEFTLTFPNGLSIDARGSSELMQGIKEGKVTEGKIEVTIGFRLNGKNLSDARPYLRIESWENVKIQ